MEKTILSKLKTAYASLGLGDTFLGSLAASLASTGLVTDENVDAVVAAQKGMLESFQKSNDKRAADALSKAKAESAASVATANAEMEQMRAKMAELSEKLNSRVANSASETAKPQPVQATPAQTAVPPVADNHDWFKAERDALMADFENRFKALSEGNKALTDTVNALRAENEAMKAEEASKARAAYINSKAKELGIPDWRVSEGFNIAGDASDEVVTEHLSKVAENIRAQVLPANGVRTPVGADGKPDMAQISEIAQRLVARN